MFYAALAILLIMPGLSLTALQFIIWRRQAGRRLGMSSWLESAGLSTPFKRLAEDNDMAVFMTRDGLALCRLLGGCDELHDMNDANAPWSAARMGEGMEDIANPLTVARDRAASMEKETGVPVEGCVIVSRETEFGGTPPFGVFRAEDIDGILREGALFSSQPPDSGRLEKAWRDIQSVPSAKLLKIREVSGVAGGGALLAAGIAVLAWIVFFS